MCNAVVNAKGKEFLQPEGNRGGFPKVAFMISFER